MLATTIKDHGEEWEDHQAKVCFAYNTSIHKSTEFMYGRQARIPIDLIYSTPEPSDQSQGEYARNLHQSLEFREGIFNRLGEITDSSPTPEDKL